MTVADEDIPMIEGVEGAEDSDEDMMVDEETDDEKSHSKKVHVSVITGFLGSGKSTVRNRCIMCLYLCNIDAHHVPCTVQIDTHDRANIFFCSF